MLRDDLIPIHTPTGLRLKAQSNLKRPFRLRVSAASAPWSLTLSATLLLPWIVACSPTSPNSTHSAKIPTQIASKFIQNQSLQEVVLDWQVRPIAQSGAYQAIGQTNLPDQTQITVAALRYLYPATAANQKSKAQRLNTKPTYAILDYQSAVVQAGQWQTQLNLWQVATDGTFQENWQMEQQGLATRFDPQPEVVFLVTLAPIDQLSTLQQQLADQGQQLHRSLIHRSATGESYAQSRQTLALNLPSGGTLAPPPQLEAENFGWGRRYLLPREPQNPTRLEQPKERLTTAPARPEEVLR